MTPDGRLARFVCVSFVATLCAQEPGADACLLSGRVVSSLTGAPVRKASVRLTDEDGENARSVETDAEGRFSFEAVNPGHHWLTVEKPGYGLRQFGMHRLRRSGTVLRLASAERRTDVEIQLIQLGAVRGRVLDEEGEPVPETEVVAMRPVYFRGRRQLTQATQASTDAAGEYMLGPLEPERYYLKATHYAEIEQENLSEKPQDDVEEGYLTTYYPNSPDSATSAPVELGPGGDLRGFDIQLRRGRLARVSGKVLLGDTGEPAKGASVMLAQMDSHSPSFQRNLVGAARADGSFEIRKVPPGAYALRANLGRSFATVIEVGERGVEGLAIHLFPQVSLLGRVRFEGNAPVRPDGIRIALEAAETFVGGYASAQAGKDGGCVLEKVALGQYLVKVYALPEGSYVKSVRYGPQEIRDSVLDLTAGVAGQLDILVSTSGAQVSGQALDADDQPFEGSLVTLIPDSGKVALYKTVTTDRNGRFSIRGIAPGDYKLLAWADIEPGAEQDPEFVRRFEGSAKTISLSESGRETVQLRVVPAEAAR